VINDFLQDLHEMVTLITMVEVVLMSITMLAVRLERTCDNFFDHLLIFRCYCHLLAYSRRSL